MCYKAQTRSPWHLVFNRSLIVTDPWLVRPLVPLRYLPALARHLIIPGRGTTGMSSNGEVPKNNEHTLNTIRLTIHLNIGPVLKKLVLSSATTENHAHAPAVSLDTSYAHDESSTNYTHNLNKQLTNPDNIQTRIRLLLCAGGYDVMTVAINWRRQVSPWHGSHTTFAASWQSDCAPSEDSDQPGHPPSLTWVIAVRSMGS